MTAFETCSKSSPVHVSVITVAPLLMTKPLSVTFDGRASAVMASATFLTDAITGTSKMSMPASEIIIVNTVV
eukprot:CAMPEP_0119468410 /NCGR_PEP_ID=MMETSP1344-20130328/2178_1 /TAXON_ID=236787 /ORGANISM="Florenciella parvula, Strain CCMP2471" /LENGTH=71 /DNA_ID=CAMNT_0007500879 /DNA_START=795 /DNA_END=1010 /DNA_ORIENTATION=-